MLMIPFAVNQLDIEAAADLAPPVCEYQVVAQGQRRFLELPMPWMWWGAVSALEQANDRTAAHLLLLELSRLEPNWDSYGADPIDAACIANAQRLLHALPITAPSPEIAPNPNGTLTLDWETDDQAISLEIGATRFSSFWESRQGTGMAEGTLNSGIPDLVARALDSLFPNLEQTKPIYEGFMIDAQGLSGFVAARCRG